MSESNKALVKLAFMLAAGFLAYNWYWQTFKKEEAIRMPPMGGMEPIKGVRQ